MKSEVTPSPPSFHAGCRGNRRVESPCMSPLQGYGMSPLQGYGMSPDQG